jgi:small subunit ribosomal protein S4
VSHGHVQVDGKTVNVSSYSLRNGQVIALKQRARKMDLVINSVATASSLRKIADYVEVDTAGYITSIKQNFTANEVPYECEMNFPLIVEYYNR